MSGNNRKKDLQVKLRKKLAVKQGYKKICVTGIMRNESKNVDRLLDSLLPLPPDMISIVDTGSTDDTEKKILDWGKKHNIPTKVHHEPFQDFAYNRTHALRAAKEAFPEADYLLLTDADFVWEVNVGDKFDRTLLIDHKYLIQQYNKCLDYWNLRMISTKVDFDYNCLTHEFVKECSDQSTYMGEIRTARINTLRIDDREDGGCKSDKYERDERLLRKGLSLQKEKRNWTRYKFYLAQTLKDLGRHEESIEWYNKRIADRGWAEEVYYAKFQIGYNYEQLGWKLKHVITLIAKSDKTKEDLEYLEKWNPNNLGPCEIQEKSTKCFADAGINYMAAYNYRKTRAEALYYCCKMYRSLAMNEMAFKLTRIGKDIAYPAQDTLFVERGCYDYLFDYETSIVAFYLPDQKAAGREAVSRLLMRDDIPDWIKQTAEKNSRHYL